MKKPREIEGFWDLYLIRPLGSVFAHVFAKIPIISPTLVSIFSLIFGVASAWYYYVGGLSTARLDYVVWAFAFFLLSSGMDSADGQLARLTNRSTQLGRTIDGFIDNLVFVALYLAILLSFYERTGNSHWGYFVMAFLAGYSHSLQSALTDYHRGIYLHFVYRRSEVVGEAPDKLKDKFKTLNGFFPKLLYYLHYEYAKKQRLFAASTRALVLKLGSSENSKLKPAYEKYQKPNLSWWALLGPNSHKIGVILTSFLPFLGETWYFQWGGLWYFVYELVFLNILMAVLILRQKKTDARIIETVES